VLALAFLNFGHGSLSVGGEYQLTADTSLCGDPLTPSETDHMVCHACRVGNAADLPPAPCAVEPVAFAVHPVVYAAAAVPQFAPDLRFVGNPRGPPSV
jgi:hypothetical protein